MTSALASRSLRNKAIAVHTAELITEVASTARCRESAKCSSPLLGSKLQTVPAIEAACLKIISRAERNATSPLGYAHKHTLSPPDLRSSHHRLEEQIRMDMEPLRQLFGNLFANGALAS